MANLTLNLDAALLRRARIRALEQGTSVNALVRDYLEGFADDEPARRGIDRFLELAAASEAGSGPEGGSSKRSEVHDRAGLR